MLRVLPRSRGIRTLLDGRYDDDHSCLGGRTQGERTREDDTRRTGAVGAASDRVLAVVLVAWGPGARCGREGREVGTPSGGCGSRDARQEAHVGNEEGSTGCEGARKGRGRDSQAEGGVVAVERRRSERVEEVGRALVSVPICH